MRTKSTQELKRRFPSSGYWMGDGCSAWICHEGLKAKVMGVGERIKDIRLEALKQPTEDTFEVAVNGRGYARLKEFPETYLMYPFEQWLKHNYLLGRKYIQVTYKG